MNARLVVAVCLVALCLGISSAAGQGCSCAAYGPAVATAYYAPGPAIATAYYAPGPVTYQPAVTYVRPVAVYRPVVVPYVAYSPVVAPAPYAAYAPVVAPAYAGPVVWVHPKVYVQGQPVRNVFRAITP
jgi:hypothetical protein